MIPPISESLLSASKKPVEPPKKLAELMTYEPPTLLPSGLQLRVPSVSVAESVLAKLSDTYLLPVTLEQLRHLESEEARAAEALRYHASQDVERVKDLMDH